MVHCKLRHTGSPAVLRRQSCVLRSLALLAHKGAHRCYDNLVVIRLGHARDSNSSNGQVFQVLQWDGRFRQLRCTKSH